LDKEIKIIHMAQCEGRGYTEPDREIKEEIWDY
jgi:hypothetical protein